MAKELQPASKAVASFNLKNFKLAKDMDSLKYQISKFGELVDAQFELIDLPMKDRAAIVSHLLKQFQLAGIFSHVDSAIFTASDNLVSLAVCINILLKVFKITLTHVDSRDFKLEQKRLKRWAKQQPFPSSFFVEMAKEVENSISSPDVTEENTADKSKSLFSNTSSGKYIQNV